MRAVRAKHLAAPTLCALAVAITSASAAASPSTSAKLAKAPLGPAHTAHAASAPRAHAASGPTVTAALQSLQRSGQITPALYAKYTSAYIAAKRSLGRLSGTRRAELGAVMSNVQAMAASGYFIASRLPVIFLTLENNRKWWTSEPLLASGTRVSFPGSKIVWEYYGGQGIEIQWLGTFGEGNGYFLSGHENANLHQLLGEVLALATKRAGGIAWEYMFQFDGGRPPWTSGLSQGTALQVLARSWQRFKEPTLLTAAQQALGIFQTPTSSGVQVKTPAGSEYAEYTYAPGDRILNGFIQATIGLYDYTQITQDPLGQKLFEAGDAEARAETPRYDTGAWSMYDQFSESNLNYHELLTEFLVHLCERTREGPPIRTTPTPAPAPTPTTPTTTTTTTPTTTTPTAPSGGTAPEGTSTTAKAAAANAKSAAIGGETGRDADRGRSDLLHDCTEIHELRENAAGHLAADDEAEGRHARGRAGLAVEDLDGAPDDPPGLAHGLDEQRVRRSRQAEAAVDDAEGRRHVQRDRQRDRSGGQLRDEHRHARRLARLARPSRRAAPRLAR